METKTPITHLDLNNRVTAQLRRGGDRRRWLGMVLPRRICIRDGTPPSFSCGKWVHQHIARWDESACRLAGLWLDR